MTKLRVLPLLGIVLCYCCCFAQAQRSVALTLLEKESLLPLVSVSVSYATTPELTHPQRVVTNTQGVAMLHLKANDTPYYYQVSYMGFKTKHGVIPQDVTTLTVYMEEDVQALAEVEVQGSSAPRPVKLSPVLTQVIGKQKMLDAGYSNIQQVLQHETPGLTIQKVGFGNEISMQGLDARHILFLMDGERMTGDMAGNLDYERFNLHALDRIEIVKGASSTLYGSRASGAVINLITKKTTRPWDIQVGGRWEQMNQRNYTNPHPQDFLYMFEKNADKPNVQAWLSAGAHKGIWTSQTDAWYSSTDAYYLYQKENDIKVYTAEANPFLPEDKVVVGTYPRPPLGIEGTEHLSLSQKIFCDPVPGLSFLVYGNAFFMNMYDLLQDLSFTQTRDYTLGAKVAWEYKNWFKLTASLHSDFYDRFKRHERIDTRNKVYDSKIIQPRLLITSNFFKEHSLVFGVEHISDDITSDRFSGQGDDTMLNRALRETEYFLQDEWTISDQYMATMGLRTNFSKVFGLMAMPKLAVKWSPTPQWALRGNYSLGYRSPGIKELFFNWDHLGMFMIRGNENLQPERNIYISGGAEYSDKNFFASANAYINQYKNKIEGVWRIYDMQYNFEYTNLPYQRIAGLDLLLRWNFLNHFTLNGSYSYVYVSPLDGLRINTTSPHAATASLDYKTERKNWKLGATLSCAFMGTKIFDIQDRISFDGENKDAYFRCTLPPYMLCNLAVTQTFYDKLRLQVGVNNLFNYIPKTLGSGITMFNVPATAGIRGYVQLEVLLDQFLGLLHTKR